ncbi:hypothetical protein QTP88_023468 [Uroleucon formosanum]
MVSCLHNGFRCQQSSGTREAIGPPPPLICLRIALTKLRNNLSLLLRVRLYAKKTTPSSLPGYPARATRYNPFVPVHIIIAFVNPAYYPMGELAAAVSATCTTPLVV